MTWFVVEATYLVVVLILKADGIGETKIKSGFLKQIIIFYNSNRNYKRHWKEMIRISFNQTRSYYIGYGGEGYNVALLFQIDWE